MPEGERGRQGEGEKERRAVAVPGFLSPPLPLSLSPPLSGKGTTMRGYHDLGGLPAGPIDRCEHDKALWEKRVHALLVLLARPDREVMSVEELRRGIESLGSA